MKSLWAFVLVLATMAGTGSYAQSSRVALSANATFHVATAGADNASCGSVGAPCATLDYLVNKVLTEIDPLDKTVTIAVAPGTYQGFTVRALLLGGCSLNV